MKKIVGFLSLCSALLFFGACGDLPACVETQLDQFKADTKDCPGTASVVEYEFQGQRVFVFNHGGCAPDKSSDVLDEACTVICSIGGMVPSMQDCQGVDFQQTATGEKTVWKN